MELVCRDRAVVAFVAIGSSVVQVVGSSSDLGCTDRAEVAAIAEVVAGSIVTVVVGHGCRSLDCSHLDYS